MVRRVALVKKTNELVGAFGQYLGFKTLVGRGHLDVDLVFQLDGTECQLALDTRRRKQLGDVFFKMEFESKEEEDQCRNDHNQVHQDLVLVEIPIDWNEDFMH